MRIYFDENFSPHLVEGIRQLQDGRKSEGGSVCSLKEEFGAGAADEVWIPSVASRHGVAITQDVNIHRTRAQWELCQANKIGVFFFKTPKKQGWSYWQIVQLVIRQWPEIKRLTEESRRPFGYVIEMHRNKIRRL